MLPVLFSGTVNIMKQELSRSPPCLSVGRFRYNFYFNPVFIADDCAYGSNFKSGEFEKLLKVRSHHEKITVLVTAQENDAKISTVLTQARYVFLQRKGFESFVPIFWKYWR